VIISSGNGAFHAALSLQRCCFVTTTAVLKDPKTKRKIRASTPTRVSSSTVSKYFYVSVAALALAAGSFHKAM
jgi:hypothetical protein